MRIADRTPFQNDQGQIDASGRMQGTLKYGINWYPQIQAQASIIAILEKTLGPNFILLRNPTLPNTDITFPLVLVGPPGVYLINVILERGNYRVRDDEWGTIFRDNLVPARINQVQRTIKFGRVLQTYLDRTGFKGDLVVEPILVAADPGLNIDTIRPAARILLLDELERYANTLNQAHAFLNIDNVAEIALDILRGPETLASLAPETVPSIPTPEITAPKASEELELPAQIIVEPSAVSSDTLGFSFDSNWNDDQTPFGSQAQTQSGGMHFPEQQEGSSHTPAFEGFDQEFNEDFGTGNQLFETSETTGPVQENPENIDTGQSETQSEVTFEPAPASPKKRGMLGMSLPQLLILGGILLFWLCSIAVFLYYITR